MFPHPIIFFSTTFAILLIFLTLPADTAKELIWTIPVCMVLSFAIPMIGTLLGDPTRKFKIKNIEKRSKAMMKMGVDNLLKKTNAELINESKRGNELYRIKTLIKGRSLKFLKYNDTSPTGRIFGCFVPDIYDDADGAMAWKYQVTPYQYSMLNQES